jgi:hypothetical protein
MSVHSSRRDLLKGLAAGVAGSAWLAAGEAMGADVPAAPAAPGPQKLSVYPFGMNVWVRVNDRPFICYRANADQKGPYFFPVYGVSGMPMTEEASEPYPHHRSLFFGCDKVNGYKFWQEGNDQGQILSRGPKVELSADKRRAVVSDLCKWRPPCKEPIIEDRRRFTIAAPSDTLRFIDADITLTALADVHVEKTNHSLFAIRTALELAPKGGGRLVNSEGQVGEKETLGKPARWCGFQGTRYGLTESIVMLDHPANPFGPNCPWFTRDYGNISPTPFLWLDEKGWDLAKGKSIRLRYRVVVLMGAIEWEGVNGLWEEFTKG